MFYMVRRVAIVGLLALIWASLASALATANTVPTSKASNTSITITPNSLKPIECASLNLTAKLAGSGTINGTNSPTLIVGSSVADTITGGSGADCILGGAGDDNLKGGGGNDVILGGPGNDTVDGQTGSGDVCYGGGQAGDTFKNCETIIP
jgi:Ca2+-binding RTX toxin-like protein